jgi:Uma2 family endonuclease
MVLAHKSATYEDLRKLPESVRAEVIHGEVVVAPSARARHGRTTTRLGGKLGDQFDPPRQDDAGWWIVADVDVQFDRHDIYRPDLSGWQRSRMLKLPDTLPITVVPDWVCEVLSPSNQRYDRTLKMTVYRDTGVRHVWLVDPQEGYLEAFENDNGRWILLGTWVDGDVVGIAPFLELELDVGALFEPVAEPTPSGF